jgi:hypothetical protein
MSSFSLHTDSTYIRTQIQAHTQIQMYNCTHAHTHIREHAH